MIPLSLLFIFFITLVSKGSNLFMYFVERYSIENLVKVRVNLFSHNSNYKYEKKILILPKVREIFI